MAEKWYKEGLVSPQYIRRVRRKHGHEGISALVQIKNILHWDPEGKIPFSDEDDQADLAEQIDIPPADLLAIVDTWAKVDELAIVEGWLLSPAVSKAKALCKKKSEDGRKAVEKRWEEERRRAAERSGETSCHREPNSAPNREGITEPDTSPDSRGNTRPNTPCDTTPITGGNTKGNTPCNRSSNTDLDLDLDQEKDKKYKNTAASSAEETAVIVSGDSLPVVREVQEFGLMGRSSRIKDDFKDFLESLFFIGGKELKEKGLPWAYDFPKQRKSLTTLSRKLKSMAQQNGVEDEEALFLVSREMVRLFYELGRSGKKFLGDQPFYPANMVSVFEYILQEANKRQDKNREMEDLF